LKRERRPRAADLVPVFAHRDKELEWIRHPFLVRLASLPSANHVSRNDSNLSAGRISIASSMLGGAI
jgi:hypothetical protein